MTVLQQLGELSRKPDQGILFGVCAGIADYYGWRRRVLRIAVFLGAIFITWPVIVCYLLAAFLLPTSDEPRPKRQRARTEANSPSPSPSATTGAVFSGGLKERYQRIEQRIRRVEAHLHGNEYQLRAAFRDLESG